MFSLNIHSFFNWISFSFLCVPFFFVAKALTLDWKLRLKECLFIFISSLIIGGVILINRYLHEVFSHILGDLTLVLFLVLYLYKIKLYPVKKAVPLMLVTMVCMIMTDLTMYIISILFSLPVPILFSAYFTYSFPGYTAYPEALVYIFPALVCTSFYTAIVLRFSKRVRQLINRNAQLQSTLMIFCISCIIFVAVIVTTWRAMTFTASFSEPSLGFVCILICILFTLFSIYTISRFSEYERQQQAIAQKNLQHYIDNLEQQQASILKFKHDYRNLLLSVQSFIHDEDWEGFKKFYSSKTEAASLAISESPSVLDSLHKIKPREIKSIVGTKILQAQNINENIQAVFEANEDINEFPINPVVLVRILGIILDNAIEALSELGQGRLFISCLKWKAGITIIVENTCRKDIAPIDLIYRPNFTTKDGRRGQGLHILNELISTSPNLMLDTTIEGGLFRQALLIENIEERSD